MLKKSLISLLLVFAIVLGFGIASYQADILPIYQMTLTVQRSSVDVYPPEMIYTAQITPAPTSTNTLYKVDFYNTKSGGTAYALIGSAFVDSTGKAVLKKQVNPGIYSAVSNAIINGQTVTSNVVQYTVY